LKIENSKLKIPVLMAIKTDIIPIKISTTKVSLGILVSQYRHRPFKNKYEKSGKRSLVFSSVLQLKQNDLPRQKLSPVLYLFAMTEIKLPRAVPIKKREMGKMYCIF